MDWNADLYENKHDFVAEYGRDRLSNVPETPGQAILDLGCGTGTLTHALLEKSTSVVGLDASPEMIGKARQLYPGMDFRVLDACLMPWNNWFDVIFSNAAFHWIPDHGALLKAVSRALKPQGKLICEFGAHRNILRIREAFRPSLERMNLPYKTRFYFPTVEEYRSMLEQAGLRPEVVMDFDRPTPLKDGPYGLRNWARQFFWADLKCLHEKRRVRIFEEMEKALRDELWDGTQWVADYRRIRVIASKQAEGPHRGKGARTCRIR